MFIKLLLDVFLSCSSCCTYSCRLYQNRKKPAEGGGGVCQLFRPFMLFKVPAADCVEGCHGMIVLLCAQIICKGRRILFRCLRSGHNGTALAAAVGRAGTKYSNSETALAHGWEGSTLDAPTHFEQIKILTRFMAPCISRKKCPLRPAQYFPGGRDRASRRSHPRTRGFFRAARRGADRRR